MKTVKGDTKDEALKRFKKGGFGRGRQALERLERYLKALREVSHE